MGEINTRGLIRSKISSFPIGNDAECLTKWEVMEPGMAFPEGSYGDSECPMINDIIALSMNIMRFRTLEPSPGGAPYYMIYWNSVYLLASHLTIHIDYSNGSSIVFGASPDRSNGNARSEYHPSLITRIWLSPTRDDTYYYVVKVNDEK